MAPTKCLPSACLPACLFACLPSCLPACLPACLLACLIACLPLCLQACLRACLHACLHACLPTCLPACLPACMSYCLPACLSYCLPACQLASLLTCLTSACLPAYLPWNPPELFRMLLELIFTVILQNITDGRTHKIPSSWAPVGAKNNQCSVHRICPGPSYPRFIKLFIFSITKHSLMDTIIVLWGTKL